MPLFGQMFLGVKAGQLPASGRGVPRRFGPRKEEVTLRHFDAAEPGPKGHSCSNSPQ